MRIVYGVHGYGRGHAMRTLSVLPELAKRHDVLVLAGGDALASISESHAVTEIPTLGFYHADNGQISMLRTMTGNLPLVRDVWLRGKSYRRIERTIRDFCPDVILTDSEIYTHKIASRLGIPRITFDHFAVLVYCRIGLPFLDAVKQWGYSIGYRALYGHADRIVATAFFDAVTVSGHVRVVGPSIRAEVRAVEPTRGEHLLVYLNRGKEEFTPQVEAALKAQALPIRVYGAPRTGTDGHIEYKPVANLPFIEDVASSRAVFATAGNQLLGEIRYFGKPVLAMPQDCLEQRINAYQVETLGQGMNVARGELTPEILRAFLDREPEFTRRIQRQTRDGATEALDALEAFISELTGKTLEGRIGLART
ncbi:MAG: hypothetical protein H6818_22305 [Phycisphaerales bacterium]|nr:hypothetical protein [Phycisphaerales bacterium]